MQLRDSAAPTFGAGQGSRDFFLPFRDGWRHDHSIQARAMIMVGILVALVIVVFLGLGIAEALTRLVRSEEQTSELQSLMRISYAVFCLKKNKQKAYHQ